MAFQILIKQKEIHKQTWKNLQVKLTYSVITLRSWRWTIKQLITIFPLETCQKAHLTERTVNLHHRSESNFQISITTDFSVKFLKTIIWTNSENTLKMKSLNRVQSWETKLPDTTKFTQYRLWKKSKSWGWKTRPNIWRSAN